MLPTSAGYKRGICAFVWLYYKALPPLDRELPQGRLPAHAVHLSILGATVQGTEEVLGKYMLNK